MKLSGLFLKIFLLLWLAQSLIFVISTTQIVRQRFPGPSTLADALDSNLQFTARAAMQSYDEGGCPGFQRDGRRHEPSGAMLLRGDGSMVCSTSPKLSLPGLVPHFPDRVDGREIEGRFVYLVPAMSRSGSRFEYVWFQPPQVRAPHRRSLLHYAFPQLPVAIVVSGLTTFAIVLLFSRPLVRLRRAASKLAEGDLTVRVEETPTKLLRSRPDEFQSLTHDFNYMAERLESLVGAQKILLRDVSHELRSPLSRLSVALELARYDAGPELQTHLTRIEKEGDKLNQLIGELLALSALESFDRNTASAPVSLNHLCEQLLPDAQFEAQRRPCEVVLEQGEELTIHGERTLLYRAVENVVRNAIRHTEPGTTVTIRLHKEQALGSSGAAILEVLDHGPGIPEQERKRIFEPFVRLDQARSSGTGGFGVGLAITKRAVTLHGGTVRAESGPEGGSAIQLRFPCS